MGNQSICPCTCQLTHNKLSHAQNVTFKRFSYNGQKINKQKAKCDSRNSLQSSYKQIFSSVIYLGHESFRQCTCYHIHNKLSRAENVTFNRFSQKRHKKKSDSIKLIQSSYKQIFFLTPVSLILRLNLHIEALLNKVAKEQVFLSKSVNCLYIEQVYHY